MSAGNGFGISERPREHEREEAELREVATVLSRHPAIGTEEFKRLLEEMQQGSRR